MAGGKVIRGLADRYFFGSIGEGMEWFRSRRDEYQVEALVAEKQAVVLANGRKIAYEELPRVLRRRHRPVPLPRYGRRIEARAGEPSRERVT